MARTVPDVALFASALSGRSSWLVRPLDQHVSSPLRVGICHTYEWAQALSETQVAMQNGAACLQANKGMVLRDVQLPVDYQQLAQAQTYIQLAEQAQCFAYERLSHWAQLSPRLQGIVQAGLAVTIEQYDQAQAQVARCRAQLADVFQDVDVLLAPSAPGAAPLGLDNTGDPVFCRIWTVLHTPTVNIPAGFAPNGMPVGLQVVGSVGADGMTLAAAHVLQECFGVSPA
jgi:Asp-tRNA(Asn)/Glu-tRNA(Gln) amidotransferase A subunit family amidase